MSFFNEINTSPIAFDVERALEAQSLFPELRGVAQELIGAAAGSSPYLWFLLQREGEWLRESGAQNAKDILQQILVAMPDGLSGDPGVELRSAKRRLALLTALADLGGVWGLEQVTCALTRLADRAVQASLNHLFLAEVIRGRMPGLSAQHQADLGGYFVLAMGKMGAFELNYSSDIDLICLFDESRYPTEDLAEIRTGFVRITKGLVKMLSEVTAQGYVFRTDLRLRPNPAVTPICIGMDHAEHYYESLGRTWERAAYIKARPCAGDIQSGEKFLANLRPFIWRRHLDFAAIQDAHDMRLRIREHNRIFSEPEVPGLNLKLAPGGIREIEFFAQTRQMICGGRDAALRERGTVAALGALGEKAWLSVGSVTELSEAYVAHRTLEHRIQMIDDAQSHTLPAQPEKLDRLARLCGQADTRKFVRELDERLALVRGLTEVFFSGNTAPSDKASVDLAKIFARPAIAQDVSERWETLPALRNERARTIFRRLLPEIMARMAGAADPDAALLQFDAFLNGLPAGVQLFSLFESNPQLLDLLVEICAIAPSLAQYLGRNAQVFDAVIGTDFFGTLTGMGELQTELTAIFAEAPDYERLLDAGRIWVKEQQFRVGVQMLRGFISAKGAAAAYSDIAEASLRALLPVVTANIAEKHGQVAGGGAVVLAMGKFGSGEMTVSSDLDLIVVYDVGSAEKSDGPRPLYVAQYFARFTQALVSAMTVQTAHGAMYKVDMRLRPSGQKGPAAVALSGFATYQLHEAWTWEHLALCRARVVAGPEALAKDVMHAVAQALGRPQDIGKVLADVRDMRQRLADANFEAESDSWEVKLGRGRMLDIEMMLQTGLVLHYRPDCRAPLAMLDALENDGWIGRNDGAFLKQVLRKLSAFQQFARLGYDGVFEPSKAGKGMMNLLCRALEVADAQALQSELREMRQKADAIVTKRLAG